LIRCYIIVECRLTSDEQRELTWHGENIIAVSTGDIMTARLVVGGSNEGIGKTIIDGRIDVLPEI
jgi:hypothetical protein